MPYQPRELFDLVADIERYPEFLPWCLAARIRRREGKTVTADLAVGFKMVRERFTSRVVLHDEADEHLRIDVSYIDGPFKYLNNHWLFLPDEQNCLLDFYVDFEFRSRLLQKVMQPLFNEAVRRMVGAFEGRAKELYGKG